MLHLAAATCACVRDEWLAAGACPEPLLPELDEALRATATTCGGGGGGEGRGGGGGGARDIILTFANLG